MRYIFVLLFIVSCAQKHIPKDPVSDVIYTFPTEEKFKVDSFLDYMKQVANIANCVIRNEAFLKEVESFPNYTFTDKTPKEVADSLRNLKPVILTTYKTKNPFSKAIATTYASDKEHVYFNTRKNPREMASMINTSLHESLHLNGYSHGDNSPAGKENSANYKVGEMAEKYSETCKR